MGVDQRVRGSDTHVRKPLLSGTERVERAESRQGDNAEIQARSNHGLHRMSLRDLMCVINLANLNQKNSCGICLIIES